MIDSVWLRISSAVPGQLVTPMTSDDVEQRPRPARVASTIASGRNGMTRNHSVSRNRIAPAQPSKKPEASPITVPITIEIDGRDRARRTARSARPRSAGSGPSGRCRRCPASTRVDGGSSTPPVALVTSSPSGSASSGASTATSDEERRTARPTMPDAVAAEQRASRLPGRSAPAAARASWPGGAAGTRRRRRVMCAPAGRAGRRAGWPTRLADDHRRPTATRNVPCSTQ